MNRTVMFIIFVTIVTSIYFGLHFFVYKCLARSLVQAANWQKILKWFLWLSGASFFISMILDRTLKIHISALNFYAYTWLGVIAIAFFIFLVQLVLSKIFPSQNKLLAIIALGVIGIISIISLVNGLQPPVVKRITIPLKKLPKELSEFSIVQLSDVHLESYKSQKRIAYIIDKVNELKPNLVVITGDLIDSNVCEEEVFCQHLNRLKASHGVLAVTGNHEFYAGLDAFMELANRSNIKVLRNESITIADTLQIIGLDDDTARQFGSQAPDPDALIKACDQNKPIILLYHQPLLFDELVQKGVDLQLSGHTHAGQIPPMDLLVWLYYKYPSGLFEKDGAYIYTTSGTGIWGPDMRFLSKNEIVHITLESK